MFQSTLSESTWLRTTAWFKAHQHWLELWICMAGVDMMKNALYFAMATRGSAVKDNWLSAIPQTSWHIIADLKIRYSAKFTSPGVNSTLWHRLVFEPLCRCNMWNMLQERKQDDVHTGLNRLFSGALWSLLFLPTMKSKGTQHDTFKNCRSQYCQTLTKLLPLPPWSLSYIFMFTNCFAGKKSSRKRRSRTRCIIIKLPIINDWLFARNRINQLSRPVTVIIQEMIVSSG